MGYYIRCFPSNSASGYLSWGKVQRAWNQGTYYPHPANAEKAAQSWLRTQPSTSYCELLDVSLALVKEIRK